MHRESVSQLNINLKVSIKFNTSFREMNIAVDRYLYKYGIYCALNFSSPTSTKIGKKNT